MSAPPGFNEQASNLPDPGAAAAPIHTMRGGGAVVNQSGGTIKSFSMEEEAILEKYGLNDDNITQHIEGFDDLFKDEFIKQIRSGKCENKGNSITQKDCGAVTSVIRAITKENIAKANARTLPGMVSKEITQAVPKKVPGAGQIVSPSDIEIELSEKNRQDANQQDSENAECDDSLAPCVRDEITDQDTESVMSQFETDIETINKLPEKYKKFGHTIRIRAPDLLDEYLQLFKIKLDDTDKLIIQESFVKKYGNPPTNKTSQSYIDYKERIRNEMNNTLVIKRSKAVDAFLIRSDVAERLKSSESSTRMSATTATPGAGLGFTSVVPTATPIAAPTVTQMPIGRGPVASSNSAYFEENPANFRKGQYGMNLNTANNSKRFYANALMGTRRMRIRGRNATNIKNRYNAKKANLNKAVAAATQAAQEARKESIEAEAARKAAQAAEKTRVNARKAAEKTAATTRKAAEVAAIQAKRAAGEKLSFMNRMRSVKNPFKRGGSRKTRKTRRNRRGSRR